MSLANDLIKLSNRLATLTGTSATRKFCPTTLPKNYSSPTNSWSALYRRSLVLFVTATWPLEFDEAASIFRRLAFLASAVANLSVSGWNGTVVHKLFQVQCLRSSVLSTFLGFCMSG